MNSNLVPEKNREGHIPVEYFAGHTRQRLDRRASLEKENLNFRSVERDIDKGCNELNKNPSLTSVDVTLSNASEVNYALRVMTSYSGYKSSIERSDDSLILRISRRN